MLPSLNPVPTFPPYRGPLRIGTAEYEIPISDLLSPSKPPDPEISTIKFRIFYPTETAHPSKISVPWLPEPQREWMDAYCDFLNAPPKISKLFSYLPLPLKHTIIPATRNASVSPKVGSDQWPVLVFSHGLGGSCNAYSHLLGSLASCGVICVAPEHRDQSAPISVIRQADGGVKYVRYLKLTHDLNPGVLRARNAQLRIRLWELELLYMALSRLNNGTCFKDLAGGEAPSLTNLLDLRPSKVAWAGHSFGAATVVQFVKSVFWRQDDPRLNGDSRSLSLFEPLYTPGEDGALKEQITTDSPVILLDLWTMPLRGDATLWLWEKPLPCYAAHGPAKGNVLAIMSDQFYNWATILERTRAVLSRDPAEHKKPDRPTDTSCGSPRLFYAPKTAHLSQSDFGILFPWPTKKWLHAEEPERTLLLNTRAILQLLRENEITVASLKRDENPADDEPTLDDPSILAKQGNIQGWVCLSIDEEERETTM